jgi:hypothetical protein
LRIKFPYVLKAGKIGAHEPEAGVTLILAAKGDEHGIDFADHHHYFARGGFS